MGPARRTGPRGRRRPGADPRPRRPHVPVPRPLGVPLPDRPRAPGRRPRLRPAGGLDRLRRADHARGAPVGGRARRGRGDAAPAARELARAARRAAVRRARRPARRRRRRAARSAPATGSTASGARKDEVELERMRAAERATAAGFAALAALVEPGRTERELQIELEATFLRSGADGLAFDTIVGRRAERGGAPLPTHRPRAARRRPRCSWTRAARSAATRATSRAPIPRAAAFTAEQAELHEVVRAAARGRDRALHGGHGVDATSTGPPRA